MARKQVRKKKAVSTRQAPAKRAPSPKKAATKAAPEAPAARLNQFGCPIGVKRDVKHLQERCGILEAGIEAGTWRGSKLELAKYHLSYYRSLLKRLLTAKAEDQAAARAKNARKVIRRPKKKAA